MASCTKYTNDPTDLGARGAWMGQDTWSSYSIEARNVLHEMVVHLFHALATFKRIWLTCRLV